MLSTKSKAHGELLYFVHFYLQRGYIDILSCLLPHSELKFIDGPKTLKCEATLHPLTGFDSVLELLDTLWETQSTNLH